MRSFALEESGVLDCFVDAGAELQRTQVAPEGGACAFSEIAGTTGVTTKSENLSETEANDILAALRTVTTRWTRGRSRQEAASCSSRPPCAASWTDDFTLANPTRFNRVPDRFSRIVEVPQVRFYTDVDLRNDAAGQFGYQKAVAT